MAIKTSATSKLNQGFTYYAGKVLGESGQYFFMSLSTPTWVFEGDAVCTETALSQSGRGRLPSFQRDIRALELENKRYSYNQAYNGSYKIYFPNYYNLGYIMISHIRKNYSDSTWNKVLNKTTDRSYWPFSLSGNLEKYTTFNLNDIYHNALNEYDSIWLVNKFLVDTDTFKTVHVSKSYVYTNYTYPFPIGKDTVLTLKSGFDNIPSLVLIHNNSETKLMDVYPVDRIHSNGKMVVWSTYVPDIRWNERSFSDIMVYRIKTRDIIQITRHGKFFAPAISKSGEFIVAIEYGSDMKCQIVILRTSDGKQIKEIVLPPQHFANMPSWSDNGKKVVFIQSFNSQKTLSILDVESGNITDLKPYTNEVISTCMFWGNYIIYDIPILGIDGIAAYDLSTGKSQWVITGKYGVYNPSVLQSDNTLYFQSYTTDGFRPCYMSLNTLKWRAPYPGRGAGDNYFRYLVDMEKSDSLFSIRDSVKIQDSQIENYSPLKHSIQIHSWYPYSVTGNGIGFSLISNDRLNILSARGGIEYFSSDIASREYVNLSYAGLFPVINAKFSNGRKYTNFAIQDSAKKLFPHNENLFSIGFLLPFNFSRNVYTTTLSLQCNYSYSLIDFTHSIPYSMPDKFRASGPDLTLEFSNKKLQSHREYYSRWGQELSAFYRYSKLKTNDGSLKSVSVISNLYFPGIFKNHSLRMYLGYENNSTAQGYGVYWLSKKLEFVRGYMSENYTEFYKVTTAYSMPLFYPDFSIGRIIYCNRIRWDLFYDIGQSNIDRHDFTDYQSVGIDLNAEIYPFSINLPLQIGIRFSHLLTNNSNSIQFLLMGISF